MTDRDRIVHITREDALTTLCGLDNVMLWAVPGDHPPVRQLRKVTCDGCRQIEKVSR